MSESGKKRPAPTRTTSAADSISEAVQPAKSAKLSQDPSPVLTLTSEMVLGASAESSSNQAQDDGQYLDGEIPASAFRLPQEMLDFSGNELPKQVTDSLADVLRRTTELQQIVDRWIKITPAERSTYFTNPLEEERMSLWIMNTIVSLGEVYCRLQGMDPEKEGLDKRKGLLSRYAKKFEELEPHSHLLSRVDAGPATRLDMPAVKRFLNSALVDRATEKGVQPGAMDIS
ncbi:hypothetical protein RvY_14424 [Ramazzottius varieornatus]|uniref:Uncharacterized protein n=1 Tax=Ramazzottius varieornatus TaxID=947166 RepID=A0A1D1VSZ4_RAMVA|nr:hypothetical protein RvY_14424 [Ramazzottius varieornatus]